MFEDINVNEEITETAEVPAAIEAAGLSLSEELNRLYSILENIDKMLYNVSSMGPSFPDDMNGEAEGIIAMANAMSDESDRLRHLADRYADMRAQTLNLIQKVKDEAKPQRKSDGFDEEQFLVFQIDMAMKSYKAMCQKLNDSLYCQEMTLDDYRAQMAVVQEDCDERIRKLRGELNALKYGG